MQFFIDNSRYDLSITFEESNRALTSSLESDLLNPGETKTGKKLKLIIGEPETGDASLKFSPDPNSTFEEATHITLTTRKRYIEEAQKTGHASARLSYGDVYIHVEG